VKSVDYLPGKNCFREGDSIFAKKLGIVSVSQRVISVIPLNSVYIPKIGDMIIGVIEEIQQNGWVVDINSPYGAFIPLSGVREYIDTTRTDLSKVYAIDDVIHGKVSLIKMDSVHISMQDLMARKLRGGRMVKINPAKVPRLIGKQGSMINLIKEKTGCRISVGQNGYVWIDGEKDDLAIKAIKKIEEESYVEGLTDKISKLLEG
jgi:exosome complex component RRP4